MTKLESLIDRGSQYLILKGVRESNARHEAERLLRASFGVTRADWAVKNPSFIDSSMERDFLSLLEKRASGLPLQYLEGSADFMDFSFRITPDVLIPRPETENLVERILTECRQGHAPTTILDIGTGSGCILLSLLKYFPQSSGVGTDINEKALEIARKNAQELGLKDRVSFHRSDLFENLTAQTFDLVVSNPPYVAEFEWEGLSPEVRKEPREALVAGPSGLEGFERIIKRAREFLVPGGTIFFEVGWNQADPIVRMLAGAGFSNIQKFQDDFGVERIIEAESHGWTKSSLKADENSRAK